MRILLVEDHKMFGESLKNSLEKDGDIYVTILGDIDNELEKEIDENNYDIILMDINIKTPTKRYNGLEISKSLIDKYKDIKIAILTGYNLIAYEREAEEIGCYGFIGKDESTKDLKEKLYRIYNNEKIVKDTKISNEELTKAEIKIITLYTSGKTRSEVAKECKISMRSLATSLSRIYSKLDVRNYQGLVDKALELGYKKIIF